MRRCALLALGMVVGPMVSWARAEPPRGPALNWVRLPGAESCITSSELAQRVEARLERSVFVLAPQAELSFDGFVQPRAAGGFSAHLAVSSTEGELLGSRDVESAEASCRALDDALVLITALTLFPGDFGLPSGGIPLDDDTNARLQALFGEEPSELDPTDLPPTAAVTPTVPTAQSTPPRAEPGVQPEQKPRPTRSRIAIEVAPVLAFGVLPGMAVGVDAELTVRLRELWPVRAGFAHFFERDARAEALTSGTGHFERNELTVFACPVSADEALAFELCVGSAIGVVSVTSDGFAEGGIHETDLALDIGGQAGVRARFFDLLLVRATVTGLLPLVQHSYEYQALDASTKSLFRSAQVGLRLQISVGAEF